MRRQARQRHSDGHQTNARAQRSHVLRSNGEAVGGGDLLGNGNAKTRRAVQRRSKARLSDGMEPLRKATTVTAKAQMS